MLYGDKAKQEARMSILKRLKQKGAPSLSPIPAPTSELSVEEETLNSAAPSDPIEQKLGLLKKRLQEDEEDAL